MTASRLSRAIACAFQRCLSVAAAFAVFAASVAAIGAAPAMAESNQVDTWQTSDIVVRDELIAAQEALLNVYRCRFSIDTQVVRGGCSNGVPSAASAESAPFEGVASTAEIAVRDELIAAQEALLNVYRCRFSIDTELVPGGCPGESTSTTPPAQAVTEAQMATARSAAAWAATVAEIATDFVSDVKRWGWSEDSEAAERWPVIEASSSAANWASEATRASETGDISGLWAALASAYAADAIARWTTAMAYRISYGVEDVFSGEAGAAAGADVAIAAVVEYVNAAVEAARAALLTADNGNVEATRSHAEAGLSAITAVHDALVVKGYNIGTWNWPVRDRGPELWQQWLAP